MAVAGHLKVVLELDDKDFTVKTMKAGKTVSEFKNSVDGANRSMQAGERHVQSFGRSMHGFLITAAAVKYLMLDLHQLFLSIPISIIKTAGEIERLTALMEGLSTATSTLGKQQEAQKSLKYIFDLAQRTPFEVKALTDVFVKLKSGGLDPMNGSMNSLVDSVARFGGGSETLHRASIAIQQMAGKGVISMEELRQQLGEAVPTAMRSMARGMNLTMAELAAQIKKGTVEANSALNKMFVQMTLESEGSAWKMAQTWAGMIEQLKTKWELFKLKIANVGAFDEMKTQLQRLLDAFNGDAAADLALTLGRAMKTATDAIISAVEWTRKWWEELKTTALVLGGLWAVVKAHTIIDSMVARVQAATAGFREAATAGVKAGQTALEMQRANHLAAANAVMAQIKGNEQQLQAAIAHAAKMDALRKEEIAREIADNNKRLAAKKALIQEQYALLQAAAAREAAFVASMPQFNAASKRFVSPSGSFVSGADAQAAAQEATRLNANTEAQRKHTQALEASAVALRAKNVQLGISAQATNLNTVAVQREAAAIALNNAALAATAAEHNKAAQAIGNMTMATRIATGAKEGMKAVLGAIINPVNIAIAAIMGLVWVWDKVTEAANAAMNRQKAALAFAEAVKKGVATAEGLAEQRKLIPQMQADLERLIRTKEQMLANPGYSGSGAGAGAIADEIAAITVEIAQKRDAINAAVRSTVEGATLVLETSANQELERLNRAMSRKIAEASQATSIELDKVEKYYEAKRNEALARGDKSAVAKLKEEELAAMKTVSEGALAARGRAIMQDIKTLESQLAKGIDEAGEKLDEAGRRAREKKLAEIKDERRKQQLEFERIQASPRVYTAEKNDKGAKEAIVREDPLNKALEAALAQQAESAAKLESLKAGAGDVANRYLEVYAIVRGKLASGAFDIKNSKGEVVESRRGLANVSLEQFLDAASGDLKRFGDLIRATAGDKATEAAIGAVSDAIKTAAGATIAFDDALERLTSGNSEKQTSGMRALERQFAQLELSVRGNAKAMDEFGKAKSDAFAKQAGADLANFAADLSANAEKNAIALILNRSERMEAAYQLEVRRVRDAYNLRRDNALKYAETHEEMLRLISEADAKYFDGMKSAWNKHVEEMKTPMQRLADQWSDVTANMEDATARWAQAGLDEFMNFVTTGKFEFKKLAESIIADIIKIQVQAQLAKVIAGAGGFLSSLFGSFGGTAASAVPGSFVGPSLGTVANGGIIGPGFYGDGVPVSAFARGGVATGPQLALFGEGSMNEAFVPLPDGRAIPVKMEGGMGNVTVNVINNTGSAVKAEQSQPRFDGKQMVLDIVLQAAGTPGPFRDNLKGVLR